MEDKNRIKCNMSVKEIVMGGLLIFIGPTWCVSRCRDSVCSSTVLFNNAVNTVDPIHEGDALHYTHIIINISDASYLQIQTDCIGRVPCVPSCVSLPSCARLRVCVRVCSISARGMCCLTRSTGDRITA